MLGGAFAHLEGQRGKNEVVTYMQEVQAQFLLEFLGLSSNIEWRKSTLKYDGILLLKGMRHLFQEIRKRGNFTAFSDHLKLEPENTRVLPSSGNSTGAAETLQWRHICSSHGHRQPQNPGDFSTAMTTPGHLRVVPKHSL